MKMNLDLSQYSLMNLRVVVPTGNYSLEIVEAETVQTAKGGWMLVLGFKVLAGEHEKAVLRRRLNIVNANADAQRIGLSELKTILTVGKHPNPDMLSDTDETKGLKLSAYIIEQDSTFTGKDGNIVNTTENDFKKYDELSEVAASTLPSTAGAVFPPQGETPVSPALPTLAALAALAAPVAAAPVAPVASSGFPWQK